jgi:hypothetical protein
VLSNRSIVREERPLAAAVSFRKREKGEKRDRDEGDRHKRLYAASGGRPSHLFTLLLPHRRQPPPTGGWVGPTAQFISVFFYVSSQMIKTKS